ncbi:MAG TPA: SRPBCC family protein [Cytophagales bacterium]|nr:SRPBCC family protein [Cytophagales bacterium]HAA18623.1 SRPBCC family protein [Cytophagales bacterium]HAP60646.1 SRPBCC family protein [Cytophagales bacterium]
MKYTVSVDIQAPRQQVVDRFQDPEDIKKWQPDFVGFKVLSGEPGQKGSKTELTHQMGRRRVVMEETILENQLPERFDAYYAAPGAKNWIENHFTALDKQTTRWVMHSEFKCSGFLRVMAALAPGMFRKQSQKTLDLFKTMMEEA